MPATIRLFAQGIAALDDEARDDAMKGRAIIKPHLRELEEIIQMARSILRIKTNLDLAELGCDRDARVDFPEFHSHELESIKGKLLTARGTGQEARDERQETRDKRREGRGTMCPVL